MRRVSLLFIVPQVRDDKDWFYIINISFLQQNCNALQCNTFRHPIRKKRLEFSTQTISLSLRLYLSAWFTRNWFKKTIKSVKEPVIFCWFKKYKEGINRTGE